MYLNASFLGLSRKETDAAFDDIVAFAELEDFIDNQVKFYSSGMLVRLGFAVAVHVDPDVLLIDEVLAVGDEAFQAKCLDRVRGVPARGPHDRARDPRARHRASRSATARRCSHHGELHAIGMPDDVVREMRYVLLGVTDPGFVPEEGTREAEIAEVQVDPARAASSEGAVLRGDPLTIQVDVRQNEPRRRPRRGLRGPRRRDEPSGARRADLARRVWTSGGSTRSACGSGSRPSRTRRASTGSRWGCSTRSTGHLYHVQTQRYLFEVVDAPSVQERVEVPVAVEVEDL